MVPQEHQLLWNKIQSFSLDDGTAEVPFSVKLAGLQSWSPIFTRAAIEEYKKFLLLCCISENGASPSWTVDEIWHLHLTYTQSYWNDLCRNVLGKDLHHHPSTGGTEEDHRHLEWYKETLELYRTVFGYDARSDIWPAPAKAPWPEPEDLVVKWDTLHSVAIVALLAFPFIFISLVYDTWVPFRLSGPHFLVFFPIYTIAVIIAYVVYRLQTKVSMDSIVTNYFPDDVTSFQVADFLYGRHRAVQAGVIDLCRRGLMEVTSEAKFLIRSSAHEPVRYDGNPLIPILAELPDGEIRTYEQLVNGWYARADFSHPALKALKRWSMRPVVFIHRYLVHVSFYGMAVLRILQGLTNGRPVVFLVLETVAFSIILHVTVRGLRKWSFISRKIKMLYGQRSKPLIDQDDPRLQRFALEGTPALSGFAEGVLLTSIFAAYAPSGMRSDAYGDWGTGSGSSCGSNSSCGSGSSCSGGSNCGGGGCGGCGGGGD